MKYDISYEDIEDVVDEILSEELIETIDEAVLEAILFDAVDEDNPALSSAVEEFLREFDRKASAALEDKMLKKIAKKHGVSTEDFQKVIGV